VAHVAHAAHVPHGAGPAAPLAAGPADRSALSSGRGKHTDMRRLVDRR
jgi:hypothetical protein